MVDSFISNNVAQTNPCSGGTPEAILNAEPSQQGGRSRTWMGRAKRHRHTAAGLPMAIKVRAQQGQVFRSVYVVPPWTQCIPHADAAKSP
jgi:hypothetical protein